jgi:hypothetical protein
MATKMNILHFHPTDVVYRGVMDLTCDICCRVCVKRIARDDTTASKRSVLAEMLTGDDKCQGLTYVDSQ